MTAAVRRNGSKYAALARSAFRQGIAGRGALVGRVVLLGVFLLIFSRLWDVVLAERSGLSIGRTELIWYLALTEWVLMSLPLLFADIEADVRSGDLACRLVRPVSYIGGRIAESAGEALLRLVSLGIAAVPLAWLLAGGFPSDPRGLLLALPLGVLASLLGLVSLAVIGLCALWIQDTSPLYWIWQKCAFVLGGLLFPLDIYPQWMRVAAESTPFAPMLYGVGRMAFGFDPELALEVGMRIGAWTAAALALLAWVHRRALQDLQVNGG